MYELAVKQHCKPSIRSRDEIRSDRIDRSSSSSSKYFQVLADKIYADVALDSVSNLKSSPRGNFLNVLLVAKQGKTKKPSFA
jgi:hypothetical protein